MVVESVGVGGGDGSSGVVLNDLHDHHGPPPDTSTTATVAALLATATSSSRHQPPFTTATTTTTHAEVPEGELGSLSHTLYSSLRTFYERMTNYTSSSCRANCSGRGECLNGTCFCLVGVAATCTYTV